MTSSTPNFATILDDSPTEVVRPTPLPVGTYTARVVGQPRYDKSSKKQTPFVEFTLRLVGADEDVDEAELGAALGSKALTERTVAMPFYLTEDAIFRLDEFHEHCGIDLADEQNRRQRNEEVVNAEVKVVIAHEASQDGATIYARPRRTLPID